MLALATLVLMAAVSTVGLSVTGVYRAPKAVAAMLRGYDLVTWVVAIPVLTLTLLPRRRHSAQAQLLRLAILGYASYNYASYVFGTGFSDVFLLHDAAFTVSIFALGSNAASLDLGHIYRSFSLSTPTRAIGALLALFSAGYGSLWIFYSLRSTLTGEPPKESLLVLPEANLHLAYVLDIALVVPGYALASVLLWRRAPWGYPMAASLLVFSLVHELNYVAALMFQSAAHVANASVFDPQSVAVLAVVSAATIALFTNMARPQSTQHKRLPPRSRAP